MQHYDFARRYLVLAPWADGLDGRGEGPPLASRFKGRKIQPEDLVAQIAQKTVLHQGFMNLDHLEKQCENSFPSKKTQFSWIMAQDLKGGAEIACSCLQLASYDITCPSESEASF